MKTTSDIAALLKHADLTMAYDHNVNRFIVHAKNVVTTSKALDTALENLAEELRRVANGMTQMHDEPVAPSQPCAQCRGTGNVLHHQGYLIACSCQYKAQS